jgi:hypothetical protein
MSIQKYSYSLTYTLASFTTDTPSSLLFSFVSLLPGLINLSQHLQLAIGCPYNFYLVISCVVGIATGYRVDGWAVGVWIPVETKFSPLYVVQICSGVHQASYPIGTVSDYPGGVKRLRREVNHSTLTSAEVKSTWICTSTSPYVSMG